MARDGLTEAVWTDILGHLRRDSAGVCRAWFGELRAGSLENGELTVVAGNEAQLSYLTTHARRPFIDAAQAATGRLVSVRFACEPDSPGAVSCPPRRTQPSFEEDNSVLRLNPDYVFENFVTGPCNQLAHAGCRAVCESLGRVYNPLFIHGSVGLGKSHLLQAVCSRALDQAPATRVYYLTCETFMNHFIEAIEQGAMHSFRYHYRHVDLLVIDDIQFLAGRDQTQEEFFHTFNTLFHMQKQIIVSADCPPSEISRLEERLVSRFNWGLVARIDSPTLETRLAIVRKKARLREMDLPEDAALFVASRINTNNRELEGALTRVQGLARVRNDRVSLSLAREALGDEEQFAAKQVRIQDIINAVASRFGVKLSEIQGRRRSKSIAFPRQVCMYLARQLTPYSLEEIGSYFGGRDHTTVLYANKLIGRRRGGDVALRGRLEEIERLLQNGSGNRNEPREGVTEC